MSLTVLKCGIDTHPCALPIGGLDFALQAQGAKPYRYKLAGDEATIRLSPARSVPAASIRLSSLGLALYDAPELYGLIASIVEEYFGPTTPEKLSRLDVAVDFQGFDLSDLGAARFVCPATFRPIYPNAEHPETYQFGRDRIVVRVYNKSRELKVSGKAWLKQLWAQHPGYDPELDVWRFEVQLRREALRERGLGSPEQAFASIPAVLRFGLEWASLRVPCGLSSDRWPVHPAWEELANSVPTTATLSKVPLDATLASLSRIAPVVAGYAISAGAVLQVFDFERVWTILGDRVRSSIGGPENFEKASRIRRLERLGKGDTA